MDIIDLPFKCEYAKSGRASCKGCKTNIGKDSLRIAAMVQSAFHDGKQPNWFHEQCFFNKQRPGSAGDIENFENLRFEDQERVKKTIDELSGSAVVAGGKGKKRSKADNAAMKDFGVEYAKSARSACKGCEQKILKDQVRIRKTVFDTEVGMKYGGQPLWHHITCFAELRGELGWLTSGDLLPGFKSLSKDDQKAVKDALPAMKAEDVPDAKKPKLEKKNEKELAEEKELADKFKSQTKRLCKFRDYIKDEMKKSEIHELLEENNQMPPSDSSKLYDQLADMLAFGAIEPCPMCKGNQILFQKSGYICNGDLTEWTKCMNVIKEPKRKPVHIPSGLKARFSFLKDVKKKVEVRAIQYIAPSASTIAKNMAMKKEDELDGPKVKRERPPCYLFQFAHINLKDSEESLKAQIAKLGGKLDTKINDKTIAIFSTQKDVDKMGARMQKAKELGIHVIPVTYLQQVEQDPSGAVRFISSSSLCDWGTDPSARLPQEELKSSSSKSIYTKSVPKSIKLTVKDGLAVDPDSGLDREAHVYVDGKDKYSVVLAQTDIQTNKNSYYKMQLLQADTKNRYWVFKAWGRIGTTIGNNKLNSFDTVHSAKSSFKDEYLKKTGNEFDDRDNFEKRPGCYYPIDVDFAEDVKIDLNAEHKVKSKLDTSVQDLIKLIFDIETMKRTMLEFDLDMEKMPLGKLSQKQLQNAYKVLTEIHGLVQNSGTNSQFIDATNRFYTLIPHNFGVRSPPLLDTIKQVEDLSAMLDSLMEIECAYSLIKNEESGEDVNPIDKHYEQLKTSIEPIDKNSEEFAMLKKYVKNTHADTHKMYELEIVDVFKVARQGEARRYKPFKKLHNRRLLWHGSRLTNFVGILSHGLKIAPPEAPVTGYMFGKGIYFADMVSKSANYCCTSKQNSTGIMLLSEVALGDMFECTSANYVTKLPKNKHSTFGKGRTMPNPAESIVREDGVEIPLGKSLTDPKLQSSLLYNEFIVYDIAQVNIQYLLRMDFKYKY
ncbi:poly [ADP-ribose] polymerase [Episyrphus balteatus]|uniref:poly [ADP-ribose] polymerase n=1 Tax=Episyrphus balteatus TaxID=286459 RepID=UPI0024850196|nr:poly [ADP-ribose] polymerase [Episyrphus balteatus]